MIRILNLIQILIVFRPLRRWGIIKPKKIIHPDFQSIECIKHGFYTRRGGVSQKPHMSLNLGFSVGDKWNKVLQNKKIIAKDFRIKPENFILIRQISKTSVHKIQNQDDINTFIKCSPNHRPEVDGIATNLEGVVIGVTTADCLPILMVDDINKVIGAAHAGWKPAKGGIIKNTVNAMLELGADVKNIKACLGPCIRQDSYEVDQKFYDLFLEEDQNNKSFFKEAGKVAHYLFDLVGYSIKKLEEAGVECVFDTDHDTYKEKFDFFSHRRNCHNGEKYQYGVQFSGICLKEE